MRKESQSVSIWAIVRRIGKPIAASCDGYVMSNGRVRLKIIEGLEFFFPPPDALLFESEQMAELFANTLSVPGYKVTWIMGGGDDSSWGF